MKKTSWEIILAGLLFVFAGIYVINNSSDSRQAEEERTKRADARTDSLEVIFTSPDSNRSFTFVHNESISELEQLKDLKNLENLENLESLKNLASYLPLEVKQEFIHELNVAIAESKKEIDVLAKPDVAPVIIQKPGMMHPENVKGMEREQWNEVSPGIYVYVKEFDAASISSTGLNLPYGSVVITGTGNTEAKLVIEASGEINNREDLDRKLSIMTKNDSGETMFSIEPSETEYNHNIHLQAVLTIPSSLQVQAMTKAGHLTAQNLEGRQFFKTGGGHIRLKETSGKIEARTGGGHIDADRAEGELLFVSSGGNITCTDCGGSTRMETIGGSLTAINHSGPLHAATKAGNVELSMNDSGNAITALTGAGNIVIRILKSADAALELTGTNIDLSGELNFSGKRNKGAIRGNIGAGGPVIKARTGYGKVVLSTTND